MLSSWNSKSKAATLRQPRRVTFAALASSFALCAVFLSGCSRLAGDQEAEEVAESEVTMEQLMNESADSPKPKRSKAAAKQPSTSNLVVADDFAKKPAVAEPAVNAKSIARERASSAASSASTNPFTKARRAGLKKHSRVPTVDKSDDIPDAADLGL